MNNLLNKVNSNVLNNSVSAYLNQQKNVIAKNGTTQGLNQQSFTTYFVNSTGPSYISGGYLASSPVDFYIMTQNQFDQWQYFYNPDTIISSGTVFNSYYIQDEPFTLKGNYSFSISGNFQSTADVDFYIMTPEQYQNLLYNNTINSVYSLGPTVSGNINANIPPGNYYAVFYPTTNAVNTVILLNSDLKAIENAPALAYPYSSASASDNFNVSLGKGIYYLVWYNPSLSAASDLTITKSIILSYS
ncbi:MAG: hypothetical protein ACP5T6_03650 [Candidatus Micrarchaeia archaeon]